MCNNPNYRAISAFAVSQRGNFNRYKWSASLNLSTTHTARWSPTLHSQPMKRSSVHLRSWVQKIHYGRGTMCQIELVSDKSAKIDCEFASLERKFGYGQWHSETRLQLKFHYVTTYIKLTKFVLMRFGHMRTSGKFSESISCFAC